MYKLKINNTQITLRDIIYIRHAINDYINKTRMSSINNEMSIIKYIKHISSIDLRQISALK